MKITYKNFKGIRPQIAPQLLDLNQAQTAANCKLSSGELRPWLNEQYKETLNNRTTIQTMYYYLSTYWFEFTADVDIVEGPIAEDTTGKRYYTGDGIPKKTNQTEALTGSGAYPINFYPLAVPTPTFAASPTLGAGGSGTARDVAYIWTIVTSWGEESAPSAASDTVNALQGQAVDLADMTLVWQAGESYVIGDWVIPTSLGSYVYKCVTAGTSGATEPSWQLTIDGDTEDNTCEWRCVDKGILYDSGGMKRIYRANTGESSIEWTLVDSIAMAATTYEDTTTDDDLEATILPSTGWLPPNDSLTGLIALSNGSFAGFVGNDVYISEPYYPHAWPEEYRFPIGATVVGLAADGNTVVVLTNERPTLLIGSHPDTATPQKLPDVRACVSKRGIVGSPMGILYPSVIGLELIRGSERITLTEGFCTRDEWADYYPATMNSVFHDGAFYGFYSSGDNEGAIVFNFKTGNISTLAFYASAAYVEPTTETLYYLKQETEVRLLESGTAYPSRTNARLTEAGDNRLLES